MDTTDQANLVSPTGVGAILSLVRHGRAITRAALGDVTGLSRTTIGQRLDALLQAGYLISGSTGSSTGGRPAAELVINPGYGSLLLAAVGASGYRAALADFCGGFHATRSVGIDVARGPTAVLKRLATSFRDMLASVRSDLPPVRGIGIGLPGPISFADRTIVRPPIMTGWDGFQVPAFFARWFDAPVLLDNDVNLMALGEWRLSFPSVSNLLFLKLGTGIGAGLVMGGALQRGAQGAAGDLGHWYMAPANRDEPEPRLCRCGNRGCLEAYAAGWALSEEFGLSGARALAERALQGDAAVLARLRLAGQHQGEALALAVNLVNPAVVVVGGSMAQDHLLAALRETVYRRSGPLATRGLQILPSQLGADAGLHGAAAMLSDALLAPDVIDRRFRSD